MPMPLLTIHINIHILIRANANFFSSKKLLAYKCIGSTIKSITNHIIVLPIQSDCHSRHMAATPEAGLTTPRPQKNGSSDKVEITMEILEIFGFTEQKAARARRECVSALKHSRHPRRAHARYSKFEHEFLNSVLLFQILVLLSNVGFWKLKLVFSVMRRRR